MRVDVDAARHEQPVPAVDHPFTGIGSECGTGRDDPAVGPETDVARPLAVTVEQGPAPEKHAARLPRPESFGWFEAAYGVSR